MSEECRHNRIVTYREAMGGPSRMWACADCGIRFYPACRVCVDVGHRNEAHPEPSDESDWLPEPPVNPVSRGDR